MSLKHVSQKLRAAADALDDLETIGVGVNETPRTAAAIVEHVEKIRKKHKKRKVGKHIVPKETRRYKARAVKKTKRKYTRRIAAAPVETSKPKVAAHHHPRIKGAVEERRRQALEFLKVNQPATTNDVARAIGLGPTTYMRSKILNVIARINDEGLWVLDDRAIGRGLDDGNLMSGVTTMQDKHAS